MSAIEYWKKRVETHHAQSIRVQEQGEPAGDFWRPFASAFRVDPHRTDDPVLNALRRDLDSSATLIDVGGGAGRFALPLALACRHVTVVEPSESMREELRQGAREAGIGNLTALAGTWEETGVDPANVVLCAHVVYGVSDIEPFVRKLDASATERVLMVMFMESPQSRLSPFWKPVHEEDRIDLPAMPELLPVLWEIGPYPDLEMVETTGPPTFEDRESAIEELRRRLYVNADTTQDRHLRTAAEDLLADTPDGLTIRGSKPRRQALVSWRPR